MVAQAVEHEAAPVGVDAQRVGAAQFLGDLKLSHAAKDFIAGAVGGMMGVIAGQPLDTLRIRLQQRGCAHRGVSGVWRAMAAQEGARGLMKGMSYPLYTTALQNAVTFQAQRATMRAVGERQQQQQKDGCSHAAALEASGGGSSGGGGSSAVGSGDVKGGGSSMPAWKVTFLAGMVAGAVQSLFSSPVELLKIRLQLQKAMPGSANYVGPLGMLRRVLAAEGLRGLMRGLPITLLRDTPSYGVYFCAYEWSAARLDSALQCMPAALQPSSGNHLVQLVAGGAAGVLGWLCVYPVDVIKSRLQSHPAAQSPYRTAWHCAAVSWREEGATAFTRGLGATLGRAFAVNAAIFATFEAAMALMNEPHSACDHQLVAIAVVVAE